MSAKRLPILAAAFSLPAIIANANPAMTAPSSASGRAEDDLPRPRAAGPLGPLVDLTIQRLLVGDQVAAAKFGTAQPIDDPIRESHELRRIRREALEAGVDPEPAAAFFHSSATSSRRARWCKTGCSSSGRRVRTWLRFPRPISVSFAFGSMSSPPRSCGVWSRPST